MLENELRTFAENYGNCHIIIVFRKQDAWIASRYRYHIHKNGHLSFDEFFNLEPNNGLWRIEDLEFYRKIQLIEKYFPNTKPLVLFQDDLKKDSWAFIDKLARYVGASYNLNEIKMQVVKKAYQDKQLYCVRGFNRMFRYNPNTFKIWILRKLHKRTREIFLHTVAAIAYLLPEKLILKEKLIPDEKLAQIRQYFEADWQKCRAYAESNS